MSKQRICATEQILPDEDWLEIKDHLQLALDQLESGPPDFIGLRQCAMYQRVALKCTNNRLEAI